MKREYAVTANDWDDKLKERFGERESIHNLSGDDIVAAIVIYGRADIREPGTGFDRFTNYWTLDFQNTYD